MTTNSQFPTRSVEITAHKTLKIFPIKNLQPGDIIMTYNVSFEPDSWFGQRHGQPMFVKSVEWKDESHRNLRKVVLVHKNEEYILEGKDIHLAIFFHYPNEVFDFEKKLAEQRLYLASQQIQKLTTQRDILLEAIQGQQVKQ
jgi:hypothetical protein